MKKMTRGIIALILLSWSAQVQAVGDFQLWTELKLAHPFGKSPWTLHWATENRFGEDASKYITFNTTLGFDYKAFKWLKGGLFYRYEKNRGKAGENRIFPQADLTTMFGHVELSTRQRFEIRLFPDDTRFRYRTRFKVGVPVAASPLSYKPYVSEELFVEPGHGGLNQTRFIVGNTFGFRKDKITFDLYYLLRRDENNPNPWTNRHVLGTSLAFKI